MGGTGGRQGAVGLAEAGEVLGVGVHGARRLVRTGDLVAELVDGRWLVDAGDLEQLRAERGRWVTIKQAATALGCTRGRVERAVRDGTLQRRPGPTRAVPSIPAADLDKLRELVEAERQAEAERVRVRELARQAASEAASEAGDRNRPPDTGHEWWTVAHAAAVFGAGATACVSSSSKAGCRRPVDRDGSGSGATTFSRPPARGRSRPPRPQQRSAPPWDEDAPLADQRSAPR